MRRETYDLATFVAVLEWVLATHDVSNTDTSRFPLWLMKDMGLIQLAPGGYWKATEAGAFALPHMRSALRR